MRLFCRSVAAVAPANVGGNEPGPRQACVLSTPSCPDPYGHFRLPARIRVCNRRSYNGAWATASRPSPDNGNVVRQFSPRHYTLLPKRANQPFLFLPCSSTRGRIYVGTRQHENGTSGSTVIPTPPLVLVPRIFQIIVSVIAVGMAGGCIHGLFLDALGFVREAPTARRRREADPDAASSAAHARCQPVV